MKTLPFVIAQLRQAYAQLHGGYVVESSHKQFADGLLAPQIRALEAILDQSGETAPSHRPIDQAPKDGTIVKLLVEFSRDGCWAPLVDDFKSWTIGFNNLDHTGFDEWEFVGWSWCHDEFTDQIAPRDAKVIGWLPFHQNGEGEDNEAIGRSYMDRFDQIVSSPGVYENYTPADDPTELLTDMENDVTEIREVAVDLAASLAAAISLLERGEKAFKKGAASDTMFDQMLNDYRASLGKARNLMTKKGQA